MRFTSIAGLRARAHDLRHRRPAAEPRIGKFVSYEVEDFTIITSRSGKQARQFMEDLAKFRVTLEKTLGKRAANIGIPTQILVVSGSEWQKYLQPRQNVAGWFQQGDFANYMVMNGDAEAAEATHIIFHEYTHFFLASQFAGEYPPWFNEGLAELMGFAKFTKDMAVLQIPMYRVYEARDGDWIPFERMIRVDRRSPEYQSHKLADSFYAQAWLTVHYGHGREPPVRQADHRLPEPAESPAAARRSGEADIRHRPRGHRQAAPRLLAQHPHDVGRHRSRRDCRR